jgi:hypothetical protein
MAVQTQIRSIWYKSDKFYEIHKAIKYYVLIENFKKSMEHIFEESNEIAEMIYKNWYKENENHMRYDEDDGIGDEYTYVMHYMDYVLNLSKKSKKKYIIDNLLVSMALFLSRSYVYNIVYGYLPLLADKYLEIDESEQGKNIYKSIMRYYDEKINLRICKPNSGKKITDYTDKDVENAFSVVVSNSLGPHHRLVYQNKKNPNNKIDGKKLVNDFDNCAEILGLYPIDIKMVKALITRLEYTILNNYLDFDIIGKHEREIYSFMMTLFGGVFNICSYVNDDDNVKIKYKVHISNKVVDCAKIKNYIIKKHIQQIVVCGNKDVVNEFIDNFNSVFYRSNHIKSLFKLQITIEESNCNSSNTTIKIVNL